MHAEGRGCPARGGSSLQVGAGKEAGLGNECAGYQEQPGWPCRAGPSAELLQGGPDPTARAGSSRSSAAEKEEKVNTVAAGPGRPLEAPGESGSFRFGRLWIRPGGGPGRRQRNRKVRTAALNGRGRRAVQNPPRRWRARPRRPTRAGTVACGCGGSPCHCEQRGRGAASSTRERTQLGDLATTLRNGLQRVGQGGGWYEVHREGGELAFVVGAGLAFDV